MFLGILIHWTFTICNDCWVVISIEGNSVCSNIIKYICIYTHDIIMIYIYTVYSKAQVVFVPFSRPAWRAAGALGSSQRAAKVWMPVQWCASCRGRSLGFSKAGNPWVDLEGRARPSKAHKTSGNDG